MNEWNGDNFAYYCIVGLIVVGAGLSLVGFVLICLR